MAPDTPGTGQRSRSRSRARGAIGPVPGHGGRRAGRKREETRVRQMSPRRYPSCDSRHDQRPHYRYAQWDAAGVIPTSRQIERIWSEGLPHFVRISRTHDRYTVSARDQRPTDAHHR